VLAVPASTPYKHTLTQVSAARLPATWQGLWESFELALEVLGRSPRTILTYRDCAGDFADHPACRGAVPELARIQRRHVEEFIAEQLQTLRPATVALRYRVMHRLFNWLVEEEEIRESPMARMHLPTVKLDPPPVLAEDEIRLLLTACKGNSFEERRDTALIRFLIDTGCRRGEVANMLMPDLDLRAGCALVRGKTGSRVVGIGKTAAYALDRYVRVRERYSGNTDEHVWLGHKGPYDPSQVTGVGLVLEVCPLGRRAAPLARATDHTRGGDVLARQDGEVRQLPV
jgi:site-specific recombinase XerD